MEHNRTLEEFVQPSTDEIATSNDNTTEEQKAETNKTDDMVKSTPYSGFHYVDNLKTDDNILNSGNIILSFRPKWLKSNQKWPYFNTRLLKSVALF